MAQCEEVWARRFFEWFEEDDSPLESLRAGTKYGRPHGPLMVKAKISYHSSRNK